ncbi:MAG: DegV family protein [Candidatus Dormibacteraeota bacterium]|nr:DegV family protein [Candidatus Dormibacteraeota bacterium]
MLSFVPHVPSVAIVTDSTSDLPGELAGRLGVTVVPLTLTLEGTSYRDGVDIGPDDFYRKLERSGGLATTSQPSIGEFSEVYKRLLADHDQVLSLHISSRLSGTAGSAQQAADMVDADRITVVDTQVVSMALGLAVLVAHRVISQGADAHEAADRTRQVVDGMKVYCVVDTLEYLHRGGRIGRAGALLGSMLQVKPVLAVQDGVVTPLERVRTKERALKRLITLAESVGDQLCAIVGQAVAPESATRLVDAIAPRCETLMELPLGPTVGTHAGPGTVGLACYPAQLLPLGFGVKVAATRP